MPCKLRTKVECWENEFTISGVIESLVDETDDYILTDNNGYICGYSEKIYENLFYRIFSNNAKGKCFLIIIHFLYFIKNYFIKYQIF